MVMANPFRGPNLPGGLPNYPVHMQLLRVTATTVPGPSGVSQAFGSSVLAPILYVAFTEQLRTDTILPNDREPCLVDDVNGFGLSPGFYLGRLAGSWNSLPLYEVVAGGTRGATGPQGPQGPAGSTGPPGPSGSGATGSSAPLLTKETDGTPEVRFTDEIRFNSAHFELVPVVGATERKVQVNLTGGSNPVMYVYDVDGTWTKPSNLDYIVVECVGGGGGGGGTEGVVLNRAAGGGGGGGGYSKRFIEASSLLSSENYIVGEGGAGGTGPTNGSDGEGTSFGTTPLLTASGGKGGTRMLATTSLTMADGGDGGFGTGGDINGSGTHGRAGVAFSGGPAIPGTGGAIGPFGAGGSNEVIGGDNSGIDGIGFGGGGSGSSSATTDEDGGGGTSGLIILWEYYT